VILVRINKKLLDFVFDITKKGVTLHYQKKEKTGK